jgi:hypothetical protein
MFDPFAPANPWGYAPYGGMSPFGHNPQQVQGFGFPGTNPWAQGTSPFGTPPQPQAWLGGGGPGGGGNWGNYGQFNPIAQQVAQHIPQLIHQAQQIAQQVPPLAQQIPQLLQQNPQLAQQAPQLQNIPQLLQQAAHIAQQVPQLLQVLSGSPQLQGGVGGYRQF